MDKILEYVAEDLKENKKIVRSLTRETVNQRLVNKKVSAFICASTAYVLVSEIRRLKQNLKIQKLEHELESIKGE